MSTDRGHPIDAATADRLLAGDRVGFEDLEELFAAATADGHPRELMGEPAAVAAFHRAVRADPPARSARSPWAHRRVRSLRLGTIGIGPVALALATVVVGAAIAAGATALPGLLDARPSPVAGTSTVAPVRVPSTSDGQGTGSPTAGPSLSLPDPALVGLCRAYLAEVARHPGKALDSKAFAALLTAAGGADRVDAFCRALLPAEPGATPSDPGQPGSHPTGPPDGSTPGSHGRSAGAA